jgi:glyoxylase-like metal-dependent hydrolase (beta-lactamase superfamily II)/rhodanese-related sulfurtransferase
VDIVPVVEEGLGNTSYLVDIGEGRALVIDPERKADTYLAVAERRGLDIAWVAETHIHADFVSGTTALAAEGATVIAAGAAGLGFAHRGVDDGTEVDLGGLILEVIATPGHTPAHVAYLLRDGARPLGVFSGGALIVGGTARTDLSGADDTERWARAAYRSLRHRLLGLPDLVALYPTHGPGSFCSTAVSGERTSTIGAERRSNPLLAGDADEETFVARLLAGLGSYPTYFDRLPALNRSGPKVLDPWPRLAPLGVARLHAAFDAGAEVVDVRPVAEFAAGHVPGSVSIELRPQFQTWLGWLIDPDRSLAFIAGPGQDRAELVRQCANVGYTNLVGELEGGIGAWADAGLPTSTVAMVNAAELTADRTVLDVRQDAEWTAGHLPGARHVELGALPGSDVPDGPMAVMCAHGQRSMTAASLLARHGQRDLVLVRDGVDEWAAQTGAAPVTGP